MLDSPIGAPLLYSMVFQVTRTDDQIQGTHLKSVGLNSPHKLQSNQPSKNDMCFFI